MPMTTHLEIGESARPRANCSRISWDSRLRSRPSFPEAQKGQAIPFQHFFVWRLHEDLCIGRLTFSLGVCVGLAALLAWQRGHLRTLEEIERETERNALKCWRWRTSRCFPKA